MSSEAFHHGLPSGDIHELLQHANVALICPGQGGQEVGMGLDIIREPSAGEVFQHADAFLSREYNGRTITPLMFYGSQDDLNRTENSQPAIFTDTLANYHVARAHRQRGFTNSPRLLAGHSLGEYTAAVISGSMDFEDGLRVVTERGRLMQEACEREKTGMLPVRANEEEVLSILEHFKALDLCLINSNDQMILGGPLPVLEEATSWMRDVLRLRAGKLLKTAGAYHSRYMKPAQEGLAKVLEDMHIEDSQTPIIANMTALPITRANDLCREFIDQLTHTVNWKGVINYIHQQHVGNIYEIGKNDTYSRMTIALIGGGAIAVTIAGIAGVATVAHEWAIHHE